MYREIKLNFVIVTARNQSWWILVEFPFHKHFGLVRERSRSTAMPMIYAYMLLFLFKQSLRADECLFQFGLRFLAKFPSKQMHIHFNNSKKHQQKKTTTILKIFLSFSFDFIIYSIRRVSVNQNDLFRFDLIRFDLIWWGEKTSYRSRKGIKSIDVCNDTVQQRKGNERTNEQKNSTNSRIHRHSNTHIIVEHIWNWCYCIAHISTWKKITQFNKIFLYHTLLWLVKSILGTFSSRFNTITFFVLFVTTYARTHTHVCVPDRSIEEAIKNISSTFSTYAYDW